MGGRAEGADPLETQLLCPNRNRLREGGTRRGETKAQNWSAGSNPHLHVSRP